MIVLTQVIQGYHQYRNSMPSEEKPGIPRFITEILEILK